MVMGLTPLKSTYTCWPEFSPQMLGTCEEPPVMVKASVLQDPSPEGGASDRERKSTRNWQMLESGGVTTMEQRPPPAYGAG